VAALLGCSTPALSMVAIPYVCTSQRLVPCACWRGYPITALGSRGQFPVRHVGVPRNAPARANACSAGHR
jgi:hypothetical protein